MTGSGHVRRDPVFWLGFVSMIVSGFAQGFFGPALDGFRGVLDGAPGWLIPSVGMMSVLVGVLIAPIIEQRFGRRTVLMASNLSAAIGMASMASSRSIATLLLGLVVFDVGFGIGANGWNSMLAEDTSGSAVASIGFANAGFGLGIFAAPLLYVWLSGNNHLVFRPSLWFTVFCYVALGALTLAVLRHRRLGRMKPALASTGGRSGWHLPAGLLLVGAGLACSGTAETVFGNFFEDQLQAWGKEATAPWKSSFWAVYVVARVLVGLLAHRIPTARLLLGFVVVGLSFAGLSALTASPFFLLGTGVIVGSGFPLSMAIGNEQGATSRQRTVLLSTGLLFGAIGSTMLGPLMESPGARTLPLIGVGVYSVFLMIAVTAVVRLSRQTNHQGVAAYG